MRYLILPALLALSACGERPVTALPPLELTTCADIPAAPDLPAVDWSSVETARPVQTQRDLIMLDGYLAVRSAWGDCAGKVAGLKAWRQSME
jgi:hypothetical protein